MTKSILIVDDESGVADLIAELLAEHGYEVRLALNGQLGLVCLAEQRPGLVLLDVMMPIFDGSEMLRAMRANPDYAAIPVIMMTALPDALPRDDPPLYQAVLHKPFTIATLLATIQQLLQGLG